MTENNTKERNMSETTSISKQELSVNEATDTNAIQTTQGDILCKKTRWQILLYSGLTNVTMHSALSDRY